MEIKRKLHHIYEDLYIPERRNETKPESLEDTDFHIERFS